MNRIMTALMISSLFAAAPAFARTHKMGTKTPMVAKGGKSVVADKAPAGEVKGAEPKTDATADSKGGEAKGGETKAPKKPKHVKKGAKTEGAAEKPAEGTTPTPAK
jgi:hypothetical protein